MAHINASRTTANVHSLTRAIAEREAARRRGVAQRMEALAAALDRALDSADLTEDQLQAALLIVSQRRARRGAEADAERNWKRISGRGWGR